MSVLPLPLSFAVSVAVPLAMAVPLPAAFSVIVLMPVTTAGLVASALFSRAAVVSFPGTLSPGRDNWTVYQGFKDLKTKSSKTNSNLEEII